MARVSDGSSDRVGGPAGSFARTARGAGGRGRALVGWVDAAMERRPAERSTDEYAEYAESAERTCGSGWSGAVVTGAGCADCAEYADRADRGDYTDRTDTDNRP